MQCTDVLVVGAGPVGLSLALDLRQRGADVTVVDAGDGRVDHPRVGTIGPRSMECYRRWGLAGDIRDAGWPSDHALDIAWVTALGGHELHRLSYGTTATRPPSPWTPEPEQVCPQHWLMPLLVEHLERTGTTVRWARRAVETFPDHDGVRVDIADSTNPANTYCVHARYVAACDGAGSPLRKWCGVGASAYFEAQVFRNILFRAPGLRSALGDREALVYFLTSPELLRYPLRAMDGDALYRLTASGADKTIQRSGAELVAQALALDVDVEILSENIWHLTHTVADRYRHGRVFFVGDAAHTLSPSGGFGMNTGIADAADLGWRLAAELDGWAGAALLDQYETERRPVAEFALRQSEANLRRTLNRVVPPEIVAEGEQGDRAREKMADGLRAARLEREFDGLDTHLGYRYSSPAIHDDLPEDTDASWQTAALPGMRSPHVPLPGGRSTLDLFGEDFVLMSATRAGAVEPLEKAFARCGVPLTIHTMTRESERAIYGEGYVLVRPDGFVAWRGHRLPDDPVVLVDRVRGAGC
jgi:2-polyprenyl-6-methoxyphenol hydroxylase-like FAD-dependent oxidoreductase